MPKKLDASRREFLSNTGKIVVGEALLLIPASASEVAHSLDVNPLKAVAKSSRPVAEFHFGASVYPELQTRDEWNSMLDHFQRAQMNCVRVSESSWGNLEPASGRYTFGWLRQFLDDLEKRKMRAILGTGSYIPPQWLVAAHPEILVQLHPGVKVHPMARHAPCLSHPLYHSAVRQYVSALAREFKDHPTVVGWQMGNEEEGSLERLCYNPACERAWRDWLKKTYHTPDEFNRRLNLVSWGMKIDSLDAVPQPGEGVEESGAALAALTLAHRHFRRDVLLNFFILQAQALRDAGVHQWLLTDWNSQWHAVADDPLAAVSMDIGGLNEYQHPDADENFWMNFAWQQDMHRSAYGKKHFITTENRFGVIGGTAMEDHAPTREQFLMWGLETAAIGTCGFFYWTGNRWRGGHWPHWGGLLDWSGHPEPDFDWAIELGGIFSKWGKQLIDHPVKATAVILNDFEQRAALDVYPHVPRSKSVLPQCYDALHRLGIGVDSMNFAAAATPSNLKKYGLALIPAATSLDDPKVIASLLEFVQGGGVVIITPFTSYMDKDGIFRGDGFASNLWELTHCVVRTVRWVGWSGMKKLGGFGLSSSGPSIEPGVQWKLSGLSEVSGVGLGGFVEYLEVDPAAETIATFASSQAILNGRPAAALRKLGSGAVLKLGFWPEDESLARLIKHLVPDRETFFADVLPRGLIAVPHTDNSIFVVNTTGREVEFNLARQAVDRLSGATVAGNTKLQPYQVWWLA